MSEIDRTVAISETSPTFFPTSCGLLVHQRRVRLCRWPVPQANADTPKIDVTFLDHPHLLRGSQLRWAPQSTRRLADPGVRRFLDCVKQVVPIDGHIEVWADGLAVANAFSHSHE
jgi:hypothetical protein